MTAAVPVGDAHSQSAVERMIPLLRSHFDNLMDRLRCFHQYEFQVEGWLKGELLSLLRWSKKSLGIKEIDREVKAPVGNGRVDVVAFLENGTRLWIELKHWHMGYQKGQRWTFTNTVQTPEAFGLEKDIVKITATPVGDVGIAIILLTNNPGPEDWTTGLGVLRRKIAPRRVAPLTTPADFPPDYFLGILRAFADGNDGSIAPPC